MKNSCLCFVAVPMALLMAGCGNNSNRKKSIGTLAERELYVRVEPAKKRVFEHRMNVQGNLEAYDSAVISARVPGPLIEVCVDVGDAVKKGETVLFKVDPAELENRLLIASEDVNTAKASSAVAEANLVRARAELEKISLDADRFSRLHNDGRVSDNEYETAVVQRKVAEAQVAVAEANVKLSKQHISQAEAAKKIAERNLSDATVLAPFDGFITSRSMEPGERVVPGSKVVSLNGAGKVKTIAFLPSQYYDDVTPGVTEFDLSFHGKPAGRFKVSAKSPMIDMTLRTFEFRGILENVKGAVPGRMGDFKVVFSSRTGISVPDQAVITRRAGPVVYVENNGTAAERPVKTGLRNDGHTEILEGLKEGERIIVEGQFLAYDGCRVNAVE